METNNESSPPDTKPDPNLGQHFLTDEAIIEELLCISPPTEKDFVLEIGAGPGNITKALAETKAKITACEIDPQFEPALTSLKDTCPNLTVKIQDALKFSWKYYTKLISNTPYHLAEAIILKAIQYQIPECVLIVSEKTRYALESETKMNYITHLFYDYSPSFDIPKKAITPQPNTESWVIHLTQRKNIPRPDILMQHLVLYEGKIKNAIIHALTSQGKTKKQAKDILSKMNLHQDVLQKSTSRLTYALLQLLKNRLSNP